MLGYQAWGGSWLEMGNRSGARRETAGARGGLRAGNLAGLELKERRGHEQLPGAVALGIEGNRVF